MLKKVMSIVVMVAMLMIAVPPVVRANPARARAQQETQKPEPYRLPPPCSDCGPGSALDDVYLSVNQAIHHGYTTVTYYTVPVNIAVAKTNLQIAFNHAQAIGNNAAANAQKTFVVNIATTMRTPPAALVTALQQSMTKYSGITPSRAAVCQWMEEHSWDMQSMVALFEQGGMLAVENNIMANFNTFTASVQSPDLVYANYHPRGRLLNVLENSPFDQFIKGLMLVALTCAFIAVIGGGPVFEGLAAAVGFIAGFADFMSGMDPGAFGGQTQQDWLNQGTGCDPCD